MIFGATAGADVTALGAETVVRTCFRPPPQAAVNTTPVRAAPGSQDFAIMTLLNFVPDSTNRLKRRQNRAGYLGWEAEGTIARLFADRQPFKSSNIKQ